jgi:hypothetical protein
MAFMDYYGPGNWKIPFTNFRLPELGWTEDKFGFLADDSSLSESQDRSTLDEYIFPAASTALNYYTSGTPTSVPTSVKDFSNTTNDSSEFKTNNPTNITHEFDVDGARLSVTNTGDVLGLSDLKQTQGYLDYFDKYGGTGSDYLEYLKSGKAQEDALIDQNYSQGMDFLSKIEQALYGSQNDFYNTFTAPYEAQIPLINQAYEQGNAAINTAKSEAYQGEQSALDSARNLYNELDARNRQAFGGAGNSSVGQASGELLGRSMMQNFGQIKQNVANTVNKLVQRGLDLKNEVDAKIQSLTMQKDAALSQAKLAFQEKLDEINSQRFQLAQDKAAAKLSALQSYNANIQNIRNQFMSFGQELEAMKVKADLELRNALTAAQQYTNGVGMNSGNDINSMFAQNQGSNLDTLSSNQFTSGFANTNPLSNIAGYYGGLSNNDDDLFGGGGGSY